MPWRCHAAGAFLGLALVSTVANVALAEPDCPEFAVSTVVGYVEHPQALSFASSGNLFVGRRTGDYCCDPARIHHISGAGTIVEEYGPVIADPDAVLFDEFGVMSAPGSVLVGSGHSGIYAIQQDQTATLVFSTSSGFENPNNLTFDHQGRLLFVDDNADGIWVSNGPLDPPGLLVSAVDPEYICVDSQDRIFTSSVDGTIRRYGPDGTPLDLDFAGGMGLAAPIALGPGGPIWGADLYAIDGAGSLLRIGMDGSVMTLCTGLPLSTGIAFGPDLALYASDSLNNRILKVVYVGGPTPVRRATWGQVKLRYR